MVEVTQADRLAYISLNNLPSAMRLDIEDGRWDHLTGLQVFTTHRITHETPLRAELDAANEEIARLREALGKICAKSNYHDPDVRIDLSSSLGDVHGIAANAYYRVKEVNMSEQTDTMTLSERIEAASGPSRELMIEAWEACFGRHHITQSLHDEYERFVQLLDMNAPESAVLTLVPDGFTYGMGQTKLDEPCWVWVAKPDVASWRGTAPTLAQAITAASLRARGF